MGPKVSVSVRVAVIAWSPQGRWLRRRARRSGGSSSAEAPPQRPVACAGPRLYMGEVQLGAAKDHARRHHNEIPGYKTTSHIGLVRGVTVGSRSVVGNFAGGIQSIFGGNLTIYTELAEHARQEALDLMVDHARRAGADAVIGMRYDANEIMEGITEVLAYGTAVKVERV